MIYVSTSTIPQRIKNLDKSIKSLLNQSKKPDKIFINIPFKYKRFNETIKDDEIPKFDSSVVEITRCEDYGPATKLLGSLDKLEKNSLVILEHARKKKIVIPKEFEIIKEKNYGNSSITLIKLK